MEQNFIKHDCELIVEALTENQHGERDDDIALFLTVLQKRGIFPDQLSLAQYLRGMAAGEYPWVESVTRVRREMQKLHAELRGKNWDVRHEYRRKKVKQELKEIVDEQTGQFTIPITQ